MGVGSVPRGAGSVPRGAGLVPRGAGSVPRGAGSGPRGCKDIINTCGLNFCSEIASINVSVLLLGGENFLVIGKGWEEGKR